MRTYLRAQLQRFFGLNITVIDPLLFVGGQFRASQWPLLHALGVRAVLNMQAERADQFVDPQPLRVHRLRVTDFHAPSVAQLADGVAFVAAAHAADLPVLVHCRAGVGRAPLMAAAYLVERRGLGSEAALRQVRAARPIVAPNRWQIARLREFEASLARTQ